MRFQSARKDAGWTQGQVAEAVGVGQSGVWLWGTGRTAPGAALLLVVSKLYGVTVDELLKDNGE